TASSWPTTTLRSSSPIRRRPSTTRATSSSVGADTVMGCSVAPGSAARASMGQGIDDLVDHHPVGVGGVGRVAGVFHGVGPLHTVAHVGVPVDEDHGAAAVVLDRAQ